MTSHAWADSFSDSLGDQYLVWLSELSTNIKAPVDLSAVPSAEWDAIAALGFDAVWLMGVWERPVGIAIASQNANLLADFRRALRDYRPEDNVGSPHCVRQYFVGQHLGDRKGWPSPVKNSPSAACASFSICCPIMWRPITLGSQSIRNTLFKGHRRISGRIPLPTRKLEEQFFARGRDPYFPAWPDVLQLNAFQPELRRGLIEALSDIASQCDGVRSDMSMLVISTILERTWGNRRQGKDTRLVNRGERNYELI